MAKMRRSVEKQLARTPPAKAPQQKALPTPSETTLRDTYLYRSAMKALVLAIACMVVAIWLASGASPFDALAEANSLAVQLIGGGLGVGIFTFTILAWGNALEIRGNLIEWKHIMIVLVMTLLVVTWSGILAFPITVAGSFGFIAYAWYASK